MKTRGTVLLAFLLLAAGAVCVHAAAPWGGLALDEPQAKHMSAQNKYYILKKLSSGQPIKVHLSFEDPQEEENRGVYQQEVIDAYAEWFEMTRFFIDKSGHAEKFVRMSKRLGKVPQVKFVTAPQEADLQVQIIETWQKLQQLCSNQEKVDLKIDACVSRMQDVPVLYFPNFWLVSDMIKEYEREHQEKLKQGADSMYFRRTLRHEIGHTLGLADQYEEAHPQLAAHDLYRSTHIREGIMNISWNFTCDDADGVVNLIDAIHGMEKNRKQGWHSLCKNAPDVYVNGIAMGTGPYVIVRKDEQNVVLQKFQNGKKVEEYPLVFQEQDGPAIFEEIPNKQVLQKDALNRVALAKGPSGEVIYYHYNYGDVNRLITKNGKIVRLEVLTQTERFDSKTSQLEKENFIYWKFLLPNRVPGDISMLVGSNSKSASYQEGPNENVALKISLFLYKGEMGAPEITGSKTKRNPGLHPSGNLEDRLQQTVDQQQIQNLVKRFEQWMTRQKI